MAATVQKIVLNASRDIPFNKLVLSQANVRRVKDGVSIEDLAESIAYYGLLQSLNVRPVIDGEGQETGTYEIPAGGRRFRALELLAKQKRLSKTSPVPCIVREAGSDIPAEEDSLVENVQRVALHPLDQFRAFKALCEKGQSEEEIAARFFVTPAVVKQRLKLVAVSPKLLDLYADDEMTLAQLMAFTVSNDHARQEEVWEAVAHSYNKEPYLIRRKLTQGAVRTSDRRAQFVGVEAYETAGGVMLRDLFEADNGGWLQDTALLDRLAIEKLAAEAEAIRAEGWKWIEVAIEFPYGHTAGLRRLAAETAAISADDEAEEAALRVEYDALSDEYGDADDLPDEVDQRLGEIEAALAAFDNRPGTYDPTEIVRAGVFVSIEANGTLRLERGYVRREDEAPVEPESATEPGSTVDPEVPDANASEPKGTVQRPVITIAGAAAPLAAVPEEDEGIKPLAERLVTELAAHRTLALRDALANDPDTAFVAVLHALCLKAFYHFAAGTCIEIDVKSASFAHQAPGLNDTPSAKAIDVRHQTWAKQLPPKAGDLWDVLVGFDRDSQAALFAHCASLSLNAVHEQWNRNPGRFAHANQVARAVSLDMVAAGWTPTVDNYLGRVTKARILEAVREAKGEAAAQLIDHLRKPDMAKEAERLLSGTGWLPEPLRMPDVETTSPDAETAAELESLPAFLADDGGTGVEDTEASPEVIAAE